MTIKTTEELKNLREGGRILAAILKEIKAKARAGIKTIELDKLAESLILDAKGVPSFKGYSAGGSSGSYPASLCVSINDEVVHGIPTARELKDGDIVGLDIGMKYKGLFTDMAETIEIGKVNEKLFRLIEITRKSLEIGIKQVRAGARVGDIGHAIQKFVEASGFGVVHELVGHGVGKKVHEDPEIPNWGRAGTGTELKENMVIAIEPMVTLGSPEVFLDKDGWTWKTCDGKPAAHFEHTMVVTKDGPEVLTKI